MQLPRGLPWSEGKCSSRDGGVLGDSAIFYVRTESGSVVRNWISGGPTLVPGDHHYVSVPSRHGHADVVVLAM
jgi:hypothetical protein